MDQKTTVEARIAILEQALVDILGQTVKGLSAVEQRAGGNAAHAHLAHVSRIYPKTRSVVFVGRGFFGDNTKYAYLAFCEHAHASNVAFYFLTEDRMQHDWLVAAGLPCLPPSATEWTSEHIRILLEAKAVVLSDCFFAHHWRHPAMHAMLQGAKTIQIWHGIPIKGIGFQVLSPALLAGDAGAAEILASHGLFDHFVASSAAMQNAWEKQFAFKNYAAIGSPRDDIFFRDLTPRDLINVDRDALNEMKAASEAGRPVILYAPTFREGGAQWFHDAGIALFAEHCRNNNYALFVNLHPAEHNNLGEMRGRYHSIRFLAPQTDIFPILKHADMLMTDYSSLVFDFMLLNRPLIFFRPDHSRFIAEGRGIVKERIDCTPGEVVHDVKQLMQAADNAVAAIRNPGNDRFRSERFAQCKQFFDHFDGKAGERLSTLILQQLDAV